MKNTLWAITAIILLSSFYNAVSLKGTWEYCGGITNGNPETAPEGYKLRRIYKESTFEAFVIEEGYKPEKYQAGNYKLKQDTCAETETFNSQSTTLTGKTINYLYSIKNDTLTLKGTLPNGAEVTEYWKKTR